MMVVSYNCRVKCAIERLFTLLNLTWQIVSFVPTAQTNNAPAESK